MPGVPTIILCGGQGTRIRELGSDLPKPMIPIGGHPILWHVMKIYASYGHTDFVLALGWLGDRIREYVLNLEAFTHDFVVELGERRSVQYLDDDLEAGWRITCAETGQSALTGTRVRRAAKRVDGDTIMVTYGDGVGDVDVRALLDHHRAHGRLATITAVRPPGRFGELVLGDADVVSSFDEKPQTSAGFISGGFMVLEREAVDRYIPADADVMLEREPLQKLASDGQLVAYRHDGFWQPMDTPRERELLASMWESGAAPWKTWA